MTSCSVTLPTAVAPTAVSSAVEPVVAWDAWQQTTGFDPARDGFSFRNYGYLDNVTNLMPADMQRLFGAGVCRDGMPTNECALIPAADVWMKEINRAMQTGHCEGMAVLSQYMYYGIIGADTFGATVPSALDLEQNPNLQREIAYWWATQATFPTRAHRVVSSPTQLVAQLRQVLHENARIDDLYTIGMYRADFSSGHTVTPIGIAQIDARTVAISIYDNNVPAEPQQILVDIVDDTWSYVAPNLNGAIQQYTGDATTNNLELTSAAPRLEQQVCHFCPDYTTADVVEEMTTFFFSSTAPSVSQLSKQFSAYFVDTLGRRVGVIRGQVFNEIPDAQLGFLRGSESQWSPLGMPMLSVPDTVEGVLRLSGAEEVPVNVSAFGPGTVVALQNMQLAANAISEIKLDQKTGQVLVASAAESAPDIVVGYTKADRSVELTVKQVKLRPGGKAAMKANQAQDDVQIVTSEAQTVRVNVVRAADAKTDRQDREVVADSENTDTELEQSLENINVAEGDVDVRPDDPPPVVPGEVAATRRPAVAATNQSNPGNRATAQVQQKTPVNARTATVLNEDDASDTNTVADINDDSEASDVVQIRPSRTRRPERDDRETEDTPRPTPTARANANTTVTPVRGRDDGENRPQPTRAPEQNGGGEAQPTRAPEQNGGGEAQPTRAPEQNGGGAPQPTRTKERDDGENRPQPTRAPEQNGGGEAQPTRTVARGGGDAPQPTKVPERDDDDDEKRPRPTKRPDKGGDSVDDDQALIVTVIPEVPTVVVVESVTPLNVVPQHPELTPTPRI